MRTVYLFKNNTISSFNSLQRKNRNTKPRKILHHKFTLTQAVEKQLMKTTNIKKHMAIVKQFKEVYMFSYTCLSLSL